MGNAERKGGKTIAALVVVVWLFAQFVAIAQACGGDRYSVAPTPAAATAPDGHPCDEGAPGCEQFCKTDVPVVAKLPQLGARPDLPPLISATSPIRLASARAVAFPPARVAGLLLDVPLFLRFAHLRL